MARYGSASCSRSTGTSAASSVPRCWLSARSPNRCRAATRSDRSGDRPAATGTAAARSATRSAARSAICISTSTTARSPRRNASGCAPPTRRRCRRPTRVIVLMGGADFWCNGMHLHCIEAADSPADASWANINRIDDLASDILRTDTHLTIAALQGNAAAGGVFLALAADRVLARSGIVLNPHYRNMGNLYGSEYWTYLLPRRVGAEQARDLMARRLPLGMPEARLARADRRSRRTGCGGVSRARAGSRCRACGGEPISSRAWPTKRRRRAADEARAPTRRLSGRRAGAHAHEFLRLRSELSHRTPSVRAPHTARVDAAASGTAPPHGRMSARAVQASLRRRARALAYRRPRAGRRLQALRLSPRAHLYELSGWVRNSGGEVEIHAEGPPERLQLFGDALLSRAPPAAAARLLDVRAVPGERSEGFRILSSTAGEELHVHVPPDLFTCDECLAELRDPTARRYRYPFINCTQCGPRYTLIRAMPYDRPNTTLDRFTLCPRVRRRVRRPARSALPRAAPGMSRAAARRFTGARQD